MKTPPILSIVSISYNQAKYIDQCIDSSREFCEGLVQHIFVDPGSSDGSRIKLLEYADSNDDVTLIFEEDLGPSDGLNKGLKVCTGEWVCFLNSDDFFVPKQLEKVLKILESEKNAHLIYGNGITLFNNRFEFKYISKYSRRIFQSGALRIFQQSTFFRSQIIRHHNIQFNVNNRSCWDLEFILEVLNTKVRTRQIRNFVGCFRLHNESISGGVSNSIDYLNTLGRLRSEYFSKKDHKWRHCIRISVFLNLIWMRLISLPERRFLKNEDFDFISFYD
jgi:glycosyltransferase involved in cell wall biosynthesis